MLSLPGNNYVFSGGPSLWTLPATSATKFQKGMFNYRRPVKMQNITDGLATTIAASESLVGDLDDTTYSEGDFKLADLAGQPNSDWDVPNPSGQIQSYLTACSNGQSSPMTSASRAFWANGALGQTIFNTMAPPNPQAPDCMTTGSTWFDGRGLASARSRHPGLVNVLYGDGSVRDVGDQIDVRIWQAQGTPWGNETLGSSGN
jgi:prepilin-type processing-associated H-X9-DG protein